MNIILIELFKVRLYDKVLSKPNLGRIYYG